MGRGEEAMVRLSIPKQRITKVILTRELHETIIELNKIAMVVELLKEENRKLRGKINEYIALTQPEALLRNENQWLRMVTAKAFEALGLSEEQIDEMKREIQEKGPDEGA